MTTPFENVFIVNACKSDGGFANPHRLFFKINRVLVEYTDVPTSIRGVGVKNSYILYHNHLGSSTK